MNIIAALTTRLKEKGLRGAFLEEMTDHFASAYEAELEKGIVPQIAWQQIKTQIDCQDLKPIQRKLFFIQHQKKLLLMSLICLLSFFSFFTFSSTTEMGTKITEDFSIPVIDSLIFGKVVDGELKITANFGRHYHPVKGKRMMHKGLDIKGNIGDAVFSPLAGIVEKIGADDARGKYIELSHPDGFTTRYYHLSAIMVQVNQSVELGMQIGKIGTTGMSTGPHLHLEILKHEQPMDPEKYLKRA